MFDALLQKPSSPRRGHLGLVVSVTVHAVLVAAIAWFGHGTPAVEPTKQEPLVLIVPGAKRQSPQTASSAPAPKRLASSTTKRIPSKTNLLTPRSVEELPSVLPEPSDEGSPVEGTQISEGTGDTGPGGDQEGTPGLPGGDSGGPETDAVMQFGGEMTRPECDRSALSEVYSHQKQAYEAHVEGIFIAQCEIMADGTVRSCKAIKPLPHLTEATLAAMNSMRCKPATIQGKPVSVRYIQSVSFSLR